MTVVDVLKDLAKLGCFVGCCFAFTIIVCELGVVLGVLTREPPEE